MAQLHTFTDFDLLPNQGAALAYGPVTGNVTTQYRVTSKFQLTQDLKAYAVCDGAIFVHPVTGHSDLVNLIIKPLFLDDVGFTPVEYFVYRGLKKSNFVDGSDNLILKTSNDATDLINEIHDTFSQAKTDSAGSPNEVTGTNPSSNTIGWDKRASTSVFLKDIFFANDADNQLAFVKKGDYIGNFSFAANRPVGFEVVLKDRFFNPDVTYLKGLEHIVTATAPGAGVIEGNEDISNMRKREEILNFIDPAAYFSVWREVGVDYKSDGNAAAEISGISNLFTNILSKFYTKNTVYLDVRNENGYSLNYYKDNGGKIGDSDYGKHIKISLNQGSTISYNYYTNYWPIFTFIVSGNNAGYNEIDISFRKAEFNPKPLVFLDYAFTGIDLNNLPQDSERFWNEPYTDPLPLNWSNEFNFLFPNIDSLLVSLVSSIKLVLIKEVYPTNPINTSIPKNHFLDNVYGPITDLPDFGKYNSSYWMSSLGKRYVEYSELGVSGIVEVGIGVSSQDVMFFNRLIAIRENPFDYLDDFNDFESGMTSTNKLLVESMNEDLLKKKNELNYFLITKSGVSNEILEIARDNGASHSISSLYMTRSQYDNIITGISNLSPYTHDLYMNIEGLVSDFDDNDKFYYSGTIKISGLNNNGIYTEEFTGLPIFSKNGLQYNTALNFSLDGRIQLGGNTLGISDFISSVKQVENIYSNSQGSSLTNVDTPDEIVTRIRSLYFGTPGREGGGLGFAQNHAIPGAPYFEDNPYNKGNCWTIGLPPYHQWNTPVCRLRTIYVDFQGNKELDYLSFSKLNNINTLTGVKRKLAPNLLDNDNNLISSGHLIYSLCSLLHGDGNGGNLPSEGYINSFDLVNSIDFTGIVGDLSSVIALSRVEADKLDHAIVSTPILDEFYSKKVSDLEVIGDIDVFGLHEAWKIVSTQNNFLFSDVLEYYYGNIIRTEHYSNRWKLYAETNDLIDSNNFWIADAGSMSYNKIKDRISLFSYLLYYLSADDGIIYKNWDRKTQLGFMLMFGSDISPESDVPNRIQDFEVEYVLDKFLLKVKNELNNEQGWSL